MPTEKGQNDVDVTEPEHNSANFAAKRPKVKDSTDDSWSKGVFAGQEDDTSSTARKEAPACEAVPDLRLRREEPDSMAPEEEDDEAEMNPALIAGAGAAVALVVFGGAFLALSSMGML